MRIDQCQNNSILIKVILASPVRLTMDFAPPLPPTLPSSSDAPPQARLPEEEDNSPLSADELTRLRALGRSPIYIHEPDKLSSLTQLLERYRTEFALGSLFRRFGVENNKQRKRCVIFR